MGDLFENNILQELIKGFGKVYYDILIGDLYKDSYEFVNPYQLEKVDMDEIGGVGSFSKDTVVFAENFVYKDDVEEFLTIMSPKGLFASLNKPGDTKLFRMRQKLNGEYRYVQSHIVRFSESKNEFKFLYWIRDIQDEIEKEQELSELSDNYDNSLYKQLIDFQKTGVIAYTLPGYDIVHVNNEALRIYGWKDTVDAQYGLKYAPGSIIDKGSALKKLKALREEDGVVSFEFIAHHDDGNDILCAAQSRSAILSSGKRVIVTTMLDITEKRKQEEEYEKAREEQIAFKKNALLGALSEDYEIVYFGNLDEDRFNIEKAASTSRSEVIETTSSSNVYSIEMRNYADVFVHEDDYDRFNRVTELSNMKQAMEHQKSVTIRYKVKPNPRGYHYYMMHFVNVSKSAGEHLVVVGIKRIDDDLRVEREAKERLERAYEEANRANASKSEFLARVSHDVRTPVNAILGLLDIAEKNQDDIGMLKEVIKKQRGVVNHLLSLLGDVLDLSELEGNKTEVLNQEFNLKDICEQALKLAQIKADEKEIKLIHDSCMGITEPMVMGNPLHVSQIIINLINNAILFNKPKGNVTFTSKLMSYDGKTAVYGFVIEDTGIGIPEEYKKHMFEPYNRIKDSDGSVGTGLGLTIVKGLVDKMNGSIDVSSKVGVGSKFTVVLPFNVADVKPDKTYEKKEIPASEPSISGMKILLVEDNELNMEIATYMLEDAGALITPAVNGKEALDTYINTDAGYFDAILMDVMMPVMDGYTATKKIRLSGKDDALAIPIIAMTANAFLADEKSAKNAGMNAHLTKPLDTRKLISVLSSFIY